MSAQVNLSKSTTFNPPPNGALGYGFDSNNNPVRINANGSTTLLVTEIESSVENILANLGIGLVADLPSVYNDGDIYVTTDTFEMYTGITAGTDWSVTPLLVKQFVTDTSGTSWVLYQFDNVELKIIGDTVAPQVEFPDSVFKLYNSTDTTKIAQFLLSGLSTGVTRALTVPDISGLLAVNGMTNNFAFGGQVSGGSYVKSFDATADFDLNKGNSQEMELTANVTSLTLSNKVNGGSYLIYLIQDTTGSRTIPIPDSTWGNPTDNSSDFITSANGVNQININVRPNGTTYYIVETYTP